MTYDEAFAAVYNEQCEITCDAIYPAFVTKAKKFYKTFKNQVIDCFTSSDIIKYNPVNNDLEYYDSPPEELQAAEWSVYEG